MARASLLAQSIARLLEAEQTSERYVDLCIVLRVHGTGEELVRVGGRWDRRLRRYVGPAKRGRVITVHQGQVKAARWFATWLRCRRSGDWSGFRRVWSAMFVGGRRGGKSHLACVALCMFALEAPGSNAWAVSPTQEETEELERAIRAILPREWFSYRGDPKFEFKLHNGFTIRMLSGHKPRALKRGGVAFALYNEGQNMTKKGFVQLRGATADSGGLTVIAANPPDDPIGLWIEEMYEKARAGKIRSEAFDFDPRDNPFIEYASLEDLQDEVDDHTYRREVLGEFVPIGNVVFHAWSDAFSIRDVPEDFIDITAEFTKKHLGRAFGHLVGMDFDKTPHMAAVILKIYRDPADKDETPLVWIVDEVVVEDADEDDLIDGLELPADGARCPCCVAAGRDGYRGWIEEGDDAARPVVCGVIPDASGEWQDSTRTKGRGSWDWLRKRRWKYLYKPDSKMEKNPEITERVKVGNALLKARSGRRRLYSCKHNEKTNRALKYWEIRNGVPYKRSDYSHICDAVTYPCWRLFPRRRTPGGGAYKSVKKLSRRKQFDGVI